MYNPRVYTASKAMYHKLWRDLAEDPDWSFVKFTASWPRDPFIEKGVDNGEVDTDYLRAAWTINVNEIIDSDFLLIYGKPSDPVKGTVFEAGLAIGAKIPVIFVGNFAPAHSWQHYHLIRRLPSLREARDYFYKYTVAAPRRKGRSDESSD